MGIKKLFLSAATAALAVTALALPAAAQSGAKVFVAHGIPGAKVDVCVGSAEVKSNFKYGNRFSANLPAGDYRIRVFLADPRECKGTKVIDQNVGVTDGLNATIVARIIGGAPGLDIFVNDTTLPSAGSTSVTVRHTAKAPTVDVYLAQGIVPAADTEPTIAGFPKGAEAGPVALPAGTYAWWVTGEGSSDPVIGPQVKGLEAGKAYQIMAVGTSPSNYRFIVIGQPGVID